MSPDAEADINEEKGERKIKIGGRGDVKYDVYSTAIC